MQIKIFNTAIANLRRGNPVCMIDIGIPGIKGIEDLKPRDVLAHSCRPAGGSLPRPLLVSRLTPCWSNMGMQRILEVT